MFRLSQPSQYWRFAGAWASGWLTVEFADAHRFLRQHAYVSIDSRRNIGDSLALGLIVKGIVCTYKIIIQYCSCGIGCSLALGLAFCWTWTRNFQSFAKATHLRVHTSRTVVYK